MNLTSNRNIILIFAGLMGLTLLAFQNCSSSLFLLSALKPASAAEKLDLSGVLAESNKEIKKSEKELETVSVPSKIIIRQREVAADSAESDQLRAEAVQKYDSMKQKKKVKKTKKKKRSR